MNEIGLDELLQLIIRDKGGSIQEYNQLMDYISFHETGPASRMDPKTKQISQKEDGTIYTGPGRGLFQFEEGEDAGGNLAVNRTVNYLKRNNITVPLWLKEIWTDSKSVDVSKLSSDQQKMLFLGYHREHPTSDFSKVWSGEQSIPQFWLNNHWGGKGSSTTEEVEEKLDLFNKSMIAKDSTDAINIRKAELFPKKDTVPFLAPSNDVEPVAIMGHCWFFEREWLRAYWADMPSTRLVAGGEDMHFSYVLQKHYNLKTYVPPHPEDDKDMWGSTSPEKYGEDMSATSRTGLGHAQANSYWKFIVSQGYRLVKDM